MKKYWPKVFNTSDNRYYFIYFLWFFLVQYGWYLDTGRIRGIDFTMIMAPLIFLIIFNTPALHTSLQSKRVNGTEKIIWVIIMGFTSWFGFFIYRFATKDKNLSEEEVMLEEKEKYWFNFGLASFSVFCVIPLLT
jgi:hypothetical protein